MATGTEIIDILVRMRGGPQAAAQAGQVERSVTRIATAAVLVGGAFKAWQGIMAGVNFNSTMEQNQIAFEQFTGSAKAANTEIEALRKLANDIPAFGFDTYATNAKKLLALGRPLGKVNDDLKTIAETALGLGLGSEGIDRMVLALGQMQSTGVVQGDELRQLQEAGIKVYDYLIKAGVITREDIGKIGDLHIEAGKAISAIMMGMQRDFGGLAKRSSGTWAFQLGALKNQATQAAGALVKPLMKLLASDVFPKMTKAFKRIADYLNNGGAERLYATLQKILEIMGPLLAAFLLYKTTLLVITGVQIVIMLGAQAIAWWGIFAAASATFGVFGGILFTLGAIVSIPALIVAAIIAIVAAVIYLYNHWGWFHRAVDNTWDAIVSGAKWVGRALKNVGEFLLEYVLNPLADVGRKVIEIFNDVTKAIGKVSRSPVFQTALKVVAPGAALVGHLPFMADGGQVTRGGMAIVGDEGPELLHNRDGVAEVTPLGSGGGGGAGTRLLQPIVLTVDGRTLAEVVVDAGQTARARA